MDTNAGTAYLDVEARLDKLESEINKQSPGIFGRWGKSAGEQAGSGITSGIGKAVAAASALAVGVGVAKFFGGAISVMQEAAKVGAQTDAVIKSTGGAANITAKQVDALSTSLSNMSGIDDEAIASGENMLLTFTEVQNRAGKGNDIFNQASRTLLDMSVAMGTDAKSTAIQLGKALNDPIKGITALQRVGVTFTQQQKDQIAAMVEVGNVAGAQKVILAELNKEFGGSAKAQATAADRLRVAWGNFQEQIGGLLAPALTGAANLGGRLIGVLSRGGQVLGRWVAGFAEAFSSVRKFGDWEPHGAFEKLGVFFAKLTGVVQLFFGSFTGKGSNASVFKGWVNPIIDAGALARRVFDDVAHGFRLLAVGFQNPQIGVALDSWQGYVVRFGQVVRTVFGFMRDNVKPILIGLGAAILAFVIPPLVAWAVAQIAAIAPVLLLGAAIAAVVAGVVIAYQRFATFRDIVQTLAEVFSSAFAVVRAVVTVAVAVISDLWARFGGQLVSHIQTQLGAVLQIFQGVLNVVKGVLDVFAGIFTGDWGRLWDGVKAIFSGVLDIIVGQLRGVLNIMSAIVGAGMAVISAAWGLALHAMATLLSDVWGGIQGFFGGIVSWFHDRVDDVVGFFTELPGRIASAVVGLWDGIKEAFRSVINWIIEKWNGLEFKIPSINFGLFHLGGQTIGVPDIPYLARGGTATSGGAALVGELGPELLDLPTGARVRPLDSAAAALDYDQLAQAMVSALLAAHLELKVDGRPFGELVSRALYERSRSRW